MAAAYNLHCFDIMTVLFKITLPATELNAGLRTVKSESKEGSKSNILQQSWYSVLSKNYAYESIEK